LIGRYYASANRQQWSGW